MNAQAIMCLQAIANALIETEAMKADNLCRADQGLAPAYDGDAFRREAFNMDNQVRSLVQWVQ